MSLNKESEYSKHIKEVIRSDPRNTIQNKEWRVCNLYYIITKRGQKEIFKPNKAQAAFLKLIPIYYRFVILKARQLGFTTLLNIWALDEILFSENKEALIIAQALKVADEIFDRKVKFALDNFPIALNHLRQEKANSKAKKFSRENGSVSSISVSNTARSGTFHVVHVTEVAELFYQYPKKAQEFISGTLPAIPMDGKLFLESTAQGMSGYFYDTFRESMDNIENIGTEMSKAMPYPVFFNWRWDEMELSQIKETIPISAMENKHLDFGEYQIEHGLSDIEITYYYQKYLMLGKDVYKLNNQYPTTPEEAFAASGQSYFSSKRMYHFFQKTVEPDRYDLFDNELHKSDTGVVQVWKLPVPGRSYVIGGDTAEGLSSGDASVLSVVDAHSKDIVAIYHAKESPYEFARDAFQLAKIYNNALLGIESNKDGLYVNETVMRLGYENMYYREELDDITKQTSKSIGWRTTRDTRDYALASLKTAFNNQDNWVQKPLLEEMLKFIRNQKGKPEAVYGSHDDIVMATAIAYAILNNNHFNVQNNKKEKNYSAMALAFGEITVEEWIKHNNLVDITVIQQ